VSGGGAAGTNALEVLVFLFILICNPCFLICRSFANLSPCLSFSALLVVVKFCLSISCWANTNFARILSACSCGGGADVGGRTTFLAIITFLAAVLILGGAPAGGRAEGADMKGGGADKGGITAIGFTCFRGLRPSATGLNPGEDLIGGGIEEGTRTGESAEGGRPVRDGMVGGGADGKVGGSAEGRSGTEGRIGKGGFAKLPAVFTIIAMRADGIDGGMGADGIDGGMALGGTGGAGFGPTDPSEELLLLLLRLLLGLLLLFDGLLISAFRNMYSKAFMGRHARAVAAMNNSIPLSDE